jgi:hypothetical protein
MRLIRSAAAFVVACFVLGLGPIEGVLLLAWIIADRLRGRSGGT